MMNRRKKKRSNSEEIGETFDEMLDDELEIFDGDLMRDG